MTETDKQRQAQAAGPAKGGAEADAAPAIQVAPGPHLFGGAFTTRRMMLEVLIGLLPVAAASVIFFRHLAIRQLAICISSCVLTECLLAWARRRPCPVGDGSAVVTGAILAFSLPGTCPGFVAVIGSVAAISIGKFIFGGLGYNLFNPAMVGRAFVMIAFAWALAAGGYVGSDVPLITSATPMTLLSQQHQATELWRLVVGNTNGSLGETSAVACVLGGLYLCLRRVASWEIPAGTILAVAGIAGAINLAHVGSAWTVLHELCGGALLLGAFFIATDPVSSPLTPKGKFIFGLGVGALVMLIRKLSAYPEGVMFSVLIMNSLVPLINRWTVPRPVGGPVPAAGKG